MCGEREHHVIDEELVDLSRPTQPFPQRRADVTDDHVIMADAKPTGEISNARRAGLCSNVVERRARAVLQALLKRFHPTLPRRMSNVAL